MNSTQLLSQRVESIDGRTTRIERKLDKLMPVIFETKKIPLIEEKVSSVEKKADEGMKLKWQLMGGFAVITFIVQFAVSLLKGA